MIRHHFWVSFAITFLGAFLSIGHGQDQVDLLSRLVQPPANLDRPGLSLANSAMQFVWSHRGIRSSLSEEQQLRLMELQEQSMELLRRRRQLEQKLGFGAPRTPEQIEASEQLGELFQESDAFMDTAFRESIEMMGEHVDDFVLALNVNAIRMKMRQAVRQLGEKELDQFKLGPEFVLQLDTFLGLDFWQQKRLREMADSLSQGNEPILQSLRQKLKDLQRSQFEEMLAVLDSDQKAKFLKVFDEPVEWPIWGNDRRIVDALRLKTEVNGQAMVFRGATASLPPNTKARLRQGDRRALEDLGYEIEDSFAWEMLGNAATQRELELSEEQIADIESTFNSLRREEKRIVTNRFGKQRLMELFGARAGIPPEIEKRLLKHQQKRFLSVEFQTRLFDQWESFTMLSPEMQLFLGLSADQNQQLAQILSEYTPQREEIWHDARRRISESLAKQRGALMRILTDAQRERLEALLNLAQASH